MCTFSILRYNNLSEPLPENLNQFVHLKRLILNTNNISGEIPQGIFNNLTNLIYLDLRFNKLTGTIPPGLGKLKQLKVLLLNNNELSGCLPDLSGLTDLEEMYVYYTYLVECTF